MSDASEAIYTAATDDLERLITELSDAKDNLDWSAVRAKAETIAAIAPLIEQAASYMGGDA